jgi:uncharacterized membrane protein YuzA (DUF378 family)
MVQLYFLSVLCNGLVGFLFIFGNFGESNTTIESSMKFSLLSGGFRLILGITTGVVGLLKLFSPMEGMPVLSDLFPAVVGIAAGFLLIFGFFCEHSAKVDDEGTIDHIGEVFLRTRKIVGVVMLVIAALHFLFPTAFFL